MKLGWGTATSLGPRCSRRDFFGIGARVVHPLFSNTSLEVAFPYRQQTLLVRSTLHPHSSSYPIRPALILLTTSSILPSRYFLFNGVDAVIYEEPWKITQMGLGFWRRGCWSECRGLQGSDGGVEREVVIPSQKLRTLH